MSLGAALIALRALALGSALLQAAWSLEASPPAELPADLPVDGTETARDTATEERDEPAADTRDRVTSTVRVGLFKAGGVHPYALSTAQDLVTATTGLELEVITARDVRRGALDELDVVLFTGGSGSAQGKALGEDGRERVREFVRRGGGYVGVCAGAYLAMQGTDEFHKLRIVAGHNLTGDFWKRGVGALAVATTEDSPRNLRLHYANGPIYTRDEVEGLAPYIVLATFVGELSSPGNGTYAGEMPGTPAILAARFGRGRILLFSPNPVLGDGDVGHGELMVDALRWAAAGGKFAKSLGFSDVFPTANLPG